MGSGGRNRFRDNGNYTALLAVPPVWASISPFQVVERGVEALFFTRDFTPCTFLDADDVLRLPWDFVLRTPATGTPPIVWSDEVRIPWAAEQHIRTVVSGWLSCNTRSLLLRRRIPLITGRQQVDFGSIDVERIKYRRPWRRSKGVCPQSGTPNASVCLDLDSESRT